MEDSVSKVHFIHNFDRHKKTEKKGRYQQYCIAYQVHNDTQLNYAVSYCHPHDHYTKQIGRILCRRRLRDDPYICSIEFLNNLLLTKINEYYDDNLDKTNVEDIDNFANSFLREPLFKNIVDELPYQDDVKKIEHISQFNRPGLNSLLNNIVKVQTQIKLLKCTFKNQEIGFYSPANPKGKLYCHNSD